MKKLELTGQRFGKLLVIKERGKNKYGQMKWECICDCGKETTVLANNLRRGVTRSCGCLVKKHGMYKTPTYKIWDNMIQRCHNLNDHEYLYYGGRGIFVCPEWRYSFKNFFRDMGIRPDRLTIERINNNGGYYSDNCKWATCTEQARNKGISSNNQSGTVGVFCHKHNKIYTATIGVEGKNIYLGCFKDKQKAIDARKQAEKRYWF